MTVVRHPGLNVHVYPSPFEYETRILKVTKAMVANGIVERVLVVATAKHDRPERERIDGQREVVRVGAPMAASGLVAKSVKFLKWSSAVMGLLRREPVTLVNCHSLSVLPLCVALARRHSAVLVYEPHELETETATSKGIRRTVAKVLERILIQFAARVIVVSESIADHYRRDYGLPDVAVVMNCPDLVEVETGEPNRLLRDRFSIPDSDIVLLYQGMLSSPRGVRLLLEAFQRIPKDRHLVLMGFGPLEGEIREIAAAYPNIHLHPPVHSDEVERYSLGADVGIALLSDDCENHECALPNKLFQYLAAGLPIVASDLKEMRRIVDTFHCGWKVEYRPDSLVRAISAIDHSAIHECQPGARKAGELLRWTHEAARLVDAYADLPPAPQIRS